MQPVVSVIVPCYNSGSFIKETLNSILAQSEKEIEVIVIDDGSTDDSAAVIRSFSDSRLNYFHQTNKGVSAARNAGFLKAKGNYVIFFDADDLMPKDFLFSRREHLKKALSADFVSGEVERFDQNGKMQGYCRGAGENLVEEILLYDQEVNTCPSNYLFRREFLEKNHLSFNTKLSSTADRFFLLECAEYGRANFSKEVTPLQYRVNAASMSNRLTPGLVLDNEMYYHELKRSSLIPKKIRNKTLFLVGFILSASYWKLNMKRKAFKFAFTSFLKDPVAFFKRIILRT